MQSKTVLKSKLYFWHHPHFKQFLTIGLIAIVGLGAGTIVAAKAIKVKTDTSSTDNQGNATKPTKLKSQSVVVPVVSPSPTANAIGSTKKSGPSKVATNKKPTEKPKPRSFRWGATLLSFPFREKNEEFLPEQFRLAQELGIDTVRVEYAVNNVESNHKVVEQAKLKNIKVMFVIPFGPNDIYSDAKLYDNAYRYVYDIVTRHKGQVPVWQLATEVASVAIIDGSRHGVDRVDYSETKYQAVSTWLKAATKAVKDADPSAFRLLNDQWIHVGFFDRFLKEGGDFDILGWNWFSDMGNDWNNPLINSKTGQRYKLMDKLKSFKRDIWITEVNRRLGSSGNNEKAQADYIATMADKAYADPAIKAFLVYNLVEDQGAPVAEAGYGLVYTDKNTYWVTGLKQAFGRYQALIKAYKP